MKIKRCIATLSAALLLAGSCVIPASAITEEEKQKTAFGYCIRLVTIFEDGPTTTNGLIVGVDEEKDALYIAADAGLLEDSYPDEACWYYGDATDAEGNLFETKNYFEIDLVCITDNGKTAIYGTDFSEVSEYVYAFCPMTEVSIIKPGNELVMLENSMDPPFPANAWTLETTVVDKVNKRDDGILPQNPWGDFAGTGAAALHESGTCVGMASFSLDKNGELITYIQGFKEVMEYLDSVGASYSYIPASSIKTSSDSGSTGSGRTGSDEETAQRYQDLGALIAKIAIPVIVLVVCLIIYFKTKKEKKNNSAGTIPADTGKTVELPPPVQPERTIQYIKGTGGVHRDTEFPLVMPLVKIGRDPSVSQIVLPSDSIAVSREHCYLQRTETGWILVDVSNYGTLLNGVIMEKNKSYSLKCGDTISIGEPAHTFIIG